MDRQILYMYVCVFRSQLLLYPPPSYITRANTRRIISGVRGLKPIQQNVSVSVVLSRSRCVTCRCDEEMEFYCKNKISDYAHICMSMLLMMQYYISTVIVIVLVVEYNNKDKDKRRKEERSIDFVDGCFLFQSLAERLV